MDYFDAYTWDIWWQVSRPEVVIVSPSANTYHFAYFEAYGRLFPCSYNIGHELTVIENRPVCFS